MSVKFWQKVTGNPESFSLESRIYHAFSFIAFLLLLFEIPFTLLIHLPVAALIASMLLVTQGYLYFLSRIKGRLKVAVILSFVIINAFTAVNYVYQAGVTGPCLLIFIISLFMIICITDKRYWPFCLTFNLLIVIVLIGWEYFQPSLIKSPYVTRRDMFLDNALAYIVLIILLYIGTTQILTNYNNQKRQLEEKALAFKQLNGEKDKLLSIISHDLRGPLASIQQYFSMMSEMKMGDEEKKSLEGHLLKTITNTQELVTNVLSWAKKQIGGHKVQLNQINLYNSIYKTAELFRSVAHRKGIRLDMDIDKRIVVTADIDMLQLVMRNLLNNAIKFSNADTVIELKAMAHNNLCMISVKDDGIGIDINKQRDIFSLDVKSTYGTGNEKGSGLGLVLCREFMQLQGGDISFTSVRGTGSVFYLTLPCEIVAPHPA
ncbi:histidine kinase [Filimonas lacunae]|nr:histidine kinase [Filimonas lacunae]